MTLTPVAVRVTVELLLPSLYGTLLKRGGSLLFYYNLEHRSFVRHFFNISYDVNLSTNI